MKTCLGPLPFLKIFPTSGVTADNAVAHLEAGAFGVGFVASLFDSADLAAGRFDAIRERAAQMVAAVAVRPDAQMKSSGGGGGSSCCSAVHSRRSARRNSAVARSRSEIASAAGAGESSPRRAFS